MSFCILFISSFNVRVAAPKKWNETALKLSQCILPFTIFIALFGSGLSEIKIWNILGKKDKLKTIVEDNKYIIELSTENKKNIKEIKKEKK